MNCVVCKKDFTTEAYLMNAVLLKTCVSCREKCKIYRDTHKAHITQQKKDYYKRHLEQYKNYYLKNAPQKLAYQKSYNAKKATEL
jgi:tRNA-dihydrouridine synthase